MSEPLALALARASAILSQTSSTARFDAELIAAHLLGIERKDMLLRVRDLDVPEGLGESIERRANGEPVQYIVGTAEFWSLPLIVTSDTLIPRPDSETLIEVAAKRFKHREPPQRILDLGTGSGALLAAALTLFPRAAGVGLDASVGAANLATRNMAALGFAGRADIRVSDWHGEGWRDALDGSFDLFLCNPPYIASDDPDLADDVRRYEPSEALFADGEGLGNYRHLIPQLPLLLNEDGIALFEIGHRQGEAVLDIGRDAGLLVALHHDLGGLPRCVELQMAPPHMK